MKKSTIISISIIVFLIITLIIIASFFDLQISQMLVDLPKGEYYTTNTFAIVFEIIGETFLYLFLAFAFGVLFWYGYFLEKKWLKFSCMAISSMAVFFAYFYFLYRIVHYTAKFQDVVKGEYFYVLFVFVGLILTLLTILSIKLFSKENIYKLSKFAVIIICVALLSNLLTQVVKGEVFGRMRYRSMNEIGDFSYYTPWFYINGTSLADKLNLSPDNFKSFPSGHTTAAAISFTLLALPFIFKNQQSKIFKIFCYVTPFILSGIVGFSRIIAGAHFLSDVLFGGLITLSFTILFIYLILILPQKQKNKNQECK